MMSILLTEETELQVQMAEAEETVEGEEMELDEDALLGDDIPHEQSAAMESEDTDAVFDRIID